MKRCMNLVLKGLMMGRLIDRLKVKCRRCEHWHIPRRISGRYHDEEREYIFLLNCRKCGHFWQDSANADDDPRW